MVLAGVLVPSLDRMDLCTAMVLCGGWNSLFLPSFTAEASHRLPTIG
jgi:hypothetical protein